MEEIGFLDALAQAREEDDQICRLTQLRQELKGLDLSELELRDCHFHGAALQTAIFPALSLSDACSIAASWFSAALETAAGGIPPS